MAKAATFGIVHMTVAFTVGYLLTGSWIVGSALALVEPAVNTVAYFFHEKIWERIRQKRRRVRAQAARGHRALAVHQ